MLQHGNWLSAFPACYRQGFKEVDALAQARGEQLRDGRLWRLRLHSPGADSLLLLFRCGLSFEILGYFSVRLFCNTML